MRYSGQLRSTAFYCCDGCQHIYLSRLILDKGACEISIVRARLQMSIVSPNGDGHNADVAACTAKDGDAQVQDCEDGCDSQRAS